MLGSLTSGELGTGVGAGQKAAGRNVQDYISARGDMGAFEELMGPLRKVFQAETDRGAAQIRESFGATGNRMSTGLAREEGLFRGESADRLNALMSQLFLGEQSNLLNAIGLQGQLGKEAIAPVFSLASMGILPEELYNMGSKWDRYTGVATDIIDTLTGLKGFGDPNKLWG